MLETKVTWVVGTRCGLPAHGLIVVVFVLVITTLFTVIPRWPSWLSCTKPPEFGITAIRYLKLLTYFSSRKRRETLERCYTVLSRVRRDTDSRRL